MLQSPTIPLHPWAVEVDLRVWPSVNDAVAANPESIYVPGEIVIRFRDAAIESLAISPLRPEVTETVRERLRAIDATPPAELNDPFSGKIQDVLYAWTDGSARTALRELIGLGAGSTPAGDDVLVGVLAGLRAFARPETLDLPPSDTAVTATRPTTIGSIQMLHAAIDGAFPEPLCDLVAILGAPEADETAVGAAVSDLLGLGSTSGAWMLAGLTAAASATP